MTHHALNNHPTAIRARHLLVGYFQMLMEKNGLRFDSDNRSEIEDIIDNILIAVSFLIEHPEEIRK